MTGHPAQPTADRLREVFRPTPRGAVGLVDDLLELCRGGPIRIEYDDGRCHVRLAGADPTAVPLPKSAFRAALARVAALCNERVPGSVTPYRGVGELADPHAAYRGVFINTPDEQRLDLSQVGDVHANGTTGH